MSEQPTPYTCKHRCERDELKDHIDALEAENKALREGLRGCLNYMENTEAELGITLGNADRARALLAKGLNDE